MIEGANDALSPFRPRPGWQRWLDGSAGALSLGVHALIALLFFGTATAAQKADEWVEVAIAKPPPPPPPPVQPEPPKPKPKPVAFKDTVKAPPLDVAPPPEAAKPRVIRQGLTMNSFGTTGTTGLSVRSGNTTAAAAVKGGPEGAEGWVGQPYYDVATQPVLLDKPDLEITDEARKAAIEGTITVSVDIDDKGRPVKVRVVKGLGYGLDENCVAAWMKTRWKPGRSGDQAVAITGIPQKCLVQALQ